MIHRATGLIPQQALLEETEDKLLLRTENYEKEFKFKKLRKFKLNENVIIKNENVIIKNENERSEIDNEFHKIRLVINKKGSDTNEVKCEDGTLIRHSSY
ncbi:hypothetical protein DMUE_0548 [Dictyocoela muelleri]|nr:hypothetical protein DMUE_0548 [Dictyocoela muelleri]